MLSAADLDVVARERRLPAFATLLDPEACTAFLARHLPESEVRGARVTYVKYKPGTSVLVGYVLDTRSGAAAAHAHAYPPDAQGRLRRAREAAAAPGPLGRGRFVWPELGIVVTTFPNDRRVAGLARFAGTGRGEALRAVFRGCPEPWESAALTPLVYKPERRFVARLEGDEARAVVKLYDQPGYEPARSGAAAFRSRGRLRVPRVLGRSGDLQALAFEWLSGRVLSEALAADGRDTDSVAAAAAALAEIHAQDGADLAVRFRRAQTEPLAAVARAVVAVLPALAERATAVGGRIAAQVVTQVPAIPSPIHGDFYAKQILVNAGAAAVLDFDEARWGDPAEDLGNFVAHLERGVLRGDIGGGPAEASADTLLSAYAAVRRMPLGVPLHTAAGLFRLAADPFRHREPDWPARTAAIVERAEGLLATAERLASRVTVAAGGDSPLAPSALDRERAAAEVRLPLLSAALDPRQARRFLDALAWPSESVASPRLLAVRLARYKAGRRALVEYDVEIRPAGGRPEVATLVGKLRAKGADTRTFALQKMLWQGGFDGRSPHGISVPEPVAVVPELAMWLQRKVPGSTVTDRLGLPGGPDLARRLAAALHLFHQRAPRALRLHGPAEEMRTLSEGLEALGARRPAWSARLARLAAGCARLASQLPAAPSWPLHRDFHPEQVLIDDDDRVWILDLDLHAQGDPALDAGNFAAHLLERGIRDPREAAGLEASRAAFVDRFAEVAPTDFRVVDAWETLALARHVHISTLFPERRASTEAVLERCEARLAAAASPDPERTTRVAVA